MTILAAIGRTEQAKETVSVAHSLATAYDTRLTVLHVIPSEDFESHKAQLEGIPEFSKFSIEQEMDSAADFAQEVINQTIEGPTTDVESQGRVGAIAEEILDEASRLDPSFLVISGKRRSPTGKAIFGSTTQSVLLNAACPVVTLMDD